MDLAPDGFGSDKLDENGRAANGFTFPREVELTPKEFDLLRALLSAGGAVVARDELLRRVWGYRSAAAARTAASLTPSTNPTAPMPKPAIVRDSSVSVPP